MSEQPEKTPKRRAPRRTAGETTPPSSREPGSELEAIPPELLRRMAQSVASARGMGDAIKDHLAVAQDLARARLAFVSTLEVDRGVLAVAAVRGRTDDTVVGARPGEGLIGRAFSTREILEGEDGTLAIPLLEGTRAFGVLSIAGARVRASREVWAAVAEHLAAAVQVAQLRDAAVRRTRDLETALAGLKSLEQARDELLGNVSHELKSPLTTIKAYLAMARKEKLGPLTEKLREATEICDRNADRLLRLINDMLLMSRLQGGRMKLADKPFGLRALAQEAAGTLAAMAAGAGVTISVERSGEVYVKGDRERALEATTHLIENAVVHNHAGGRVDISVSAESGVALLRVRDTGPGIHPDDLPHIFDRFHLLQGSASKPRGSGLGLAIVRQIVQLHGGTVYAESTHGEGAQFTVSLPLFAGAVSLGARPAEPRDGAILLVEDDNDCREVLAQVLESEGLVTVQAPDSDEAIRVLAHTRPALVLLDLRLGAGDGRTVLQYIRGDERLANIPVFVISGAADSAAGFRYDGAERIDGFFEKPLNLPRLLDRIQEVVRPGTAASGAS